MTGKHLIPAKSRIWFLTLIAGAGLLSFGRNVCGQEALRISTAGDLAAASRQQAASSLGYYNLLLGPVALRFLSGLEVDYNDNVRVATQGQESDIIFHPNLTTQMNWPVTEKNNLNLTLGAGYSAYLKNSDLDQFYINPGSGVSFDVYVGDFVFNLHDRISITENAYQNQSATGNQTLTSLQNDAGVSVFCDLNKLVTTVGYDHVNYASLKSSQSSQPDGASEIFFLNSGVRVLPEILTGLEAGGGFINYDQSNSTNSVVSPDATQWNVGAFCTAKISEYLDVRLDAGYTVFTPDTISTNYNSSPGFYFQFLLSHRVNRFVSYSLSAGRSTDFAYGGQPYQRYFAQVSAQWIILKNYQISTPFGWEHGSESYNQASSYDQYTAGISIGRPITKKLSGSLAYRFIKESSAQSTQNYINNIVSLSFSYQF